MIPHIVVNNAITLFFTTKGQRTVPLTEELRAMINNGALEDEILEAIDIPTKIAAQTFGKVRVVGDEIYYDSEPVQNYIVGVIVDRINSDQPIDAVCHFLDRLMLNPSYRAREALYRFLEAGQMPITSDGHFLAYKKVRQDYRDVHSGTYTNTPGATIEMPRDQVDDDPTRTCSAGLHVCSWSYLQHFSGDRVVVCKIDPKDVVAVPIDYNDAKMRVCKYTVVSEVEAQAPVWGPYAVIDDYDQEEGDDEDEYDFIDVFDVGNAVEVRVNGDWYPGTVVELMSDAINVYVPTFGNTFEIETSDHIRFVNFD